MSDGGERGPAAGSAAAAAAQFAHYGAELIDAIDAVLAAWVVRAVHTRWEQFHGAEAPAEVLVRAEQAGQAARQDVVGALRSLLALDAEEQWTNPLALVRRAARYATEVLAAGGVAHVVRDRFAEQTFPEDVYDLVPASFADVDPSLHEPGLLWGAAKAHTVLVRRKGRG